MNSSFGVTLLYAIPILTLSLLGKAEETATSTSQEGELPGLRELSFHAKSKSIRPGEAVTVGLLVNPEENHHTYWKGPGIVGVATMINWSLPEGFTAGPTLWPAPEKVNMFDIRANGYRGETMLFTEIQVPENLSPGAHHFEAEIAWMSCFTSCNPGFAKRSIRFFYDPNGEFLSQSSEEDDLFCQFREKVPNAAPDDWNMRVSRLDEDTISLTLSIPDIDSTWAEGLEFFSHDMQVDSDTPTRIRWTGEESGELVLLFARPSFAPKDPEFFSGLIKSDRKWPGLNSHFAEISIPWSEEAPDE